MNGISATPISGNPMTPSTDYHQLAKISRDARQNTKPAMIGDLWPTPSVAVDTSEAAADALDTTEGRKRKTSLRMRMLRVIASRESGFSDDELEAEFGLPGNTICPRRLELVTAGYLDTSALTRPTRKGRQAHVHFCTAKGRALLGIP